MANICAQNEQIDVPIESEKAECVISRWVTRGRAKAGGARRKTRPRPERAALRQSTLATVTQAKPLNAVISRPNVSAFITALGKSKRGLVSWAMFAGKSVWPELTR